MDDLIPQTQRPERSQMEAVQRELERRSNDRVQVYNPTNKDISVLWNKFVHRVPAGQNAILPRYVAEKFVKETVDSMINQENEKKVEAENKHRVSSGQKVMDAQERLVFDLRTNNPEVRRKYISQVYRGVVEEYGTDVTPQEVSKPAYQTDADLLSEIDKQKGVAPTEPQPEAVVEDAKKKLTRKVADGSAN